MINSMPTCFLKSLFNNGINVIYRTYDNGQWKGFSQVSVVLITIFILSPEIPVNYGW